MHPRAPARRVRWRAPWRRRRRARRARTRRRRGDRRARRRAGARSRPRAHANRTSMPIVALKWLSPRSDDSAANDHQPKEPLVPHMVIYRGSDGQPGYHEVDELNGAITYVEHLRNNSGVERARIFRMEEVGFEFRPYYRVEIGDAAPEPAPAPWGPAPAARDEREAARDMAADMASAAPSDMATDEPADADADREPAAADDSVWAAADQPVDDRGPNGEEPVGNVRRGLFGR